MSKNKKKATDKKTKAMTPERAARKMQRLASKGGRTTSDDPTGNADRRGEHVETQPQREARLRAHAQLQDLQSTKRELFFARLIAAIPSSCGSLRVMVRPIFARLRAEFGLAIGDARRHYRVTRRASNGQSGTRSTGHPSQRGPHRVPNFSTALLRLGDTPLSVLQPIAANRDSILLEKARRAVKHLTGERDRAQKRLETITAQCLTDPEAENKAYGAAGAALVDFVGGCTLRGDARNRVIGMKWSALRELTMVGNRSLVQLERAMAERLNQLQWAKRSLAGWQEKLAAAQAALRELDPQFIEPAVPGDDQLQSQPAPDELASLEAQLSGVRDRLATAQTAAQLEVIESYGKPEEGEAEAIEIFEHLVGEAGARHNVPMLLEQVECLTAAVARATRERDESVTAETMA